jgi:hypothetical protein
MKKTLALLLVIVFAVALMAGCGSTTATPSTSPSTSVEPSAAPSTDPSASVEPSAAAPETVKTGFAVVTSIDKSKDAGEEDGLAQADSVLVAVIVDNTGKILNCVIDTAQSKANFNAKGEVVTPLDTAFMTKNELGADYGMSKASTIGKDWFEQAAVLADYFVGKTVAEIKGIAVDAEGHATGSDLTASVTIKINGYIDAVEKAVANAQELGATAGDTIGIGTATNIAKSANVSDKDGLVQFYSTYTAVTKDASGMVTSCIIDASQSNINFDATGKITTDLTVAPQTKNELGDAYGMKKASSIGKEWNEQAAAFAAYVTGKTAAEVAGIAVSEGYAGDADLKASVTVHITDFMAIIAKALA